MTNEPDFTLESGSGEAAATCLRPAGASEAILFVDDDLNLLESFQRQFRRKYSVETALGPERGLETVSAKGPFALVVSDLRMPGMNGNQFLAAVRAQCPDTVRVMLTGQADLSDAISAVNQGAIFRFLLKPSSATVLQRVVEAGLEQHRLQVAERQLTQQTLLGCVEVLAEVLSIVEPRAFSRAMRVRATVRRLAEILDVPEAWRFEVAAMLSQIGWITLDPATAAKAALGTELTSEEKTRFDMHPASAARIIEKIPRLETVARIIERQQSSYIGFFKPVREKDENVTLGATMLRAAIDYDRLRERNLPDEEILEQMHGGRGVYHPRVLTGLARMRALDSVAESTLLTFEELKPGMVLYQDFVGSNGLCLLGRGQQLTETMLQRLRGNPDVIDAQFVIRVQQEPAA